jgi:hypothetical protein
MEDYIQVATLALQVLGLLGLVWYVTETMKMRKAAQSQVDVSQKLIKAANDQIEGLSRPCITLAGELRDGNDVIMERFEIVGNIRAAQDQGGYIFQNVGTGVALNIRYNFTRRDNENEHLGGRYIPHLMASGRVTLPEGPAAYDRRHTVAIEYESVGKRHYRSTIVIEGRIITSFSVEEATS